MADELTSTRKRPTCSFLTMQIRSTLQLQIQRCIGDEEERGRDVVWVSCEGDRFSACDSRISHA